MIQNRFRILRNDKKRKTIMKKTISLILIILAVMTVLPACSRVAKAIDFPFIDVKTGDWYYDNVKYVFEKGIQAFHPKGLSAARCA